MANSAYRAGWRWLALVGAGWRWLALVARTMHLGPLARWPAGPLARWPAGPLPGIGYFAAMQYVAVQHGGGLGLALAVSVRAASTNNFYF